mmetsp:Transcript_32236/g.36215  ORF Transcript_32236/g.36215 Transcript_32236/m.36215 type:complete len:698 (+) Transcript_32236:31-2124(+)
MHGRRSIHLERSNAIQNSIDTMNNNNNHQSSTGTVTVRFLITCLLSCSFAAFTIGRITRHYFVPDFANVTVMIEEISRLQQLQLVPVHDTDRSIPTPKAQAGKYIPNTIYTTKNFDTRLSASTTSQWLQPADKEDNNSSPNTSPTNNVNVVPDPLNEKLSFDENTGDAHYEKEEEEHLPAGQHLLVDINGLDASFLNSEARLATAMLSLVDNSGLTLLSYHCHGLYPEGVSCAGVLLESHVAFHTWPTEGVITLDLFTCGSASLLDSMPLIENLFVVKGEEKEKEPIVLWAYKRRGFNEQSSSIGERDTFAYPLGILGMDYKKEIASMKTSTGKIARVYEMQEHNLSSTSKQFYMDGVLKSNSFGQASAHESFVHPPMLAHDAPKRVVIFGAGLGASTREVLKHQAVEHVTIVGADKDVAEFARKHLSEWNDCSYAPSTKYGNIDNSCFDDSRVNFVHDQTPSEWIANYDGIPFDVALVDLFDMEEEFAIEMMINRQSILDQLYSTLSYNGVISMNIAGSTKVVESMTKSGITPTRKLLQNRFARELKNFGFVESFEYDEYKIGFPETRSYVIAFKDTKTSKHWNANQAEIEIKLRNRIVRNQSGHTSLEVFDAATMTSYSKFTTASQQNDLQQTISTARINARQATEQSKQSRPTSMNSEVNSSCSNVEGPKECETPQQIDLPQESVAESWTTLES